MLQPTEPLWPGQGVYTFKQILPPLSLKQHLTYQLSPRKFLETTLRVAFPISMFGQQQAARSVIITAQAGWGLLFSLIKDSACRRLQALLQQPCDARAGDCRRPCPLPHDCHLTPGNSAPLTLKGPGHSSEGAAWHTPMSSRDDS